VIPEVLKLVERELGLERSTPQQDEQQLMTDVEAAQNDAAAGGLDVSPALLQNLPTHVAAWLTINSMRMEQLQFYQLCLQNMHSVWRKKAFSALLHDSLTPSLPTLVRDSASCMQRFVTQ